MQSKILSVCLGFVVIIAVLGGLAHQQGAQMGRLAVGIYDHAFIGMSYVDQTQEEFLRIAAVPRQVGATDRADFQRVIDRLDVALERAASERTRSAGMQARGLLAALPGAAAADLPERMAQTDRAITRLVKKFAADGLQSRDEAEALVAHSDRLVLIEIAVAVGLALAVGWLVGRILSRPLAQLVHSIDRLAIGELEHEVAPSLVRRSDEIGAVARAAAVFRGAMRQNARAGEEREREREKTEAERRRAAVLELKRMRLLSDISQEILIIHRDGVILQINAAGGRMFGVPDDQLIGRRILNLIAEVDHPAILRRALRREADLDHEEIHLHIANGTLVPVEFSCSTIDYEGTPATVMAFRDLSDHKRDAARIRHLAHHDALTDLPNRFLLQERLTHALDLAARSANGPALFYLDLDRFKPVNDMLGHAAGDALLIQVAKRLHAELRPTDTLARVGGDEFVIVALLDHPENVALLAGRLVDSLAQPFELGDHQVEIGTSIGIALYPKDGDCQQTLMHAADTALYRAKQEKRGTFRFFEPAMDEHLQARRQLERDLRRAIERRQLLLHYQPLVSCVTGKVEGFEALIRWNHPERGLVAPNDFIPLAEETGLIVEIGQWVLETACEAAARWDEPQWVAVNVSPVQFRQSDLPSIVSAILARTGLPASRLEIEMTESVLMEDSKRAAGILSALREQGVRLALDDFGTGYSSLSYLHAFKFDKLKIDRSFIARLGEAEDATIIVRTIIGLAHNLGLSIVAEGVETPQQLELIRDLMCDQVQGYLLGRPKPMDSSIERVTSGARALDSDSSRAETRLEELYATR
ncbi:MAG: domain S-box-containing protein/diguanylate cyclase protein [Rhodopila sp.]|jgi:diguanylate cyclase (GGDEF)-like protein/PAS domain S-box-containing protein|nr:domain S-box-containing protein/diguanylate cyclase protein [Rhodopila sp.]